MLKVALKPGLRDGKRAFLRPLCGHDELFVNGTDPFYPVAFLDRLLVKAPGTTVGPGKAGELAVCDCDRLYAALYQNCFGEQIEGLADCRECSESFELGFSLRRLMADLEAGAASSGGEPDEEGVYSLPDGRRFRLPTAADQQQVSRLDPAEAAAALLDRCLVEGDPDKEPAVVQAVMEAVGGILAVDLDATCPRCGAMQTVRFDIQTHFLDALTSEKRLLQHEIHHIAMAYGWGYDAILSLPREDRRSFVRLIAGNRKSGGRSS